MTAARHIEAAATLLGVEPGTLREALRAQNKGTPESYRYVTVGQAAEALGVSRATVFSLLRAGRLRRVKLGERTTRIPAADLDALAEGGGVA